MGVTTAVPGAAQAVTCGSQDPATGEPALAVLTLNDTSDTDATFKRDTGTRAINLVYEAAGCTFAGSEEPPTVTVTSVRDADELPPDAVSLKSSTFDPKEMTLGLQVDSANFKPGTYGGQVAIRASYLENTRTPITVSRSTSHMWGPIGVGALGGIVAIVWFLLVKFATRNQLQIAAYWLVVAIVGAAVVGAFTVWSSYMSQDVWTLDENATAAFLAAFTGATTGSMATLLAALWASPAPDPAPGPAPSPAPAPAPAPAPPG